MLENVLKVTTFALYKAQSSSENFRMEKVVGNLYHTVLDKLRSEISHCT